MMPNAPIPFDKKNAFPFKTKLPFLQKANFYPNYELQ